MGSYAFLSIKGRMRGFRNMKDLNAHNIVNVTTIITMITNTNHIRKITVARNTETRRRLGRFGTMSDAHLWEVVSISSKKLGIDDYQVVEILICGMLRREEGEGTDRLTGLDNIMVNQPLYQIYDHGVLRMKKSS